MFCPSCGKQNKDTAVFCEFCGKAMPQKTNPLPTVQPVRQANLNPKEATAPKPIYYPPWNW